MSELQYYDFYWLYLNKISLICDVEKEIRCTQQLLLLVGSRANKKSSVPEGEGCWLIYIVQLHRVRDRSVSVPIVKAGYFQIGDINHISNPRIRSNW